MNTNGLNLRNPFSLSLPLRSSETFSVGRGEDGRLVGRNGKEQAFLEETLQDLEDWSDSFAFSDQVEQKAEGVYKNHPRWSRDLDPSPDRLLKTKVLFGDTYTVEKVQSEGELNFYVGNDSGSYLSQAKWKDGELVKTEHYRGSKDEQQHSNIIAKPDGGYEVQNQSQSF